MSDDPLLKQLKAEEEEFVNDDNFDEKLQKVGGWTLAPCFPCMTVAANAAVLDVVDKCGYHAGADLKYEDYDYSLFSGMYEAPDTPTIEIEFTDKPDIGQDPYSLEESERLQQLAAERFEDIYRPIIPTGLTLYALLSAGGFFTGYIADCSTGPAVWGFIFPIMAVLLQLYVLNKLTILMSQTNIEGRPFLRLLKYLSGLDSYRVVAVLTILDIFGRFTRAQFVGYITHCNDAVNQTWVSIFKHQAGTYTQLFTETLGISGFSLLCFIVGPLVIQQGYMLYLRSVLQKELSDTRNRQPGQPMNITDSIDDLGALLEWAMLVPAGKVMYYAKTPLSIRSMKDVRRMADRMRTNILITIARDFPDGSMQCYLQAWFLCIVFPFAGPLDQFQMLLNIVLSAIGVIGDSIDLLGQNRVITVLVALILLTSVSFALIRTVGCFVCESSVLGLGMEIFKCVPEAAITHKGWIPGVLPG